MNLVLNFCGILARKGEFSLNFRQKFKEFKKWGKKFTGIHQNLANFTKKSKKIS